MVKKIITRKVITPASKKEAVAKQVPVSKPVAEEGSSKEVRTKRVCFFCGSKTNPSYTDLTSLRRLLTDRAKIVNKERSGVCSKHQRAVAKNIKYARHLALFPSVPKI